MSKRTLIVLLLGLIALLLVAVACAPAPTPPPPTAAPQPTAVAAPPIPVRIAWQPYASFLFYTARDLGLFEKAGLKPEYVKFTAGPPQFAALQSASVDISLFGTAGMVVGYSQGIEFENFYIQVQSSYSDGLVVRKDAGISSVTDLKGKKVAYSRGTSAHLGLVKALAKYNMTMNDVQALTMDVTAMAPAFTNKDIVAAYSWEPWISKMEATDGKAILRTHDVGLYTSDHWAVRTAWAKENPEGMRRLLYAIDLATDAFKKDPSAAVKATAENVGVDEAMAKHIVDITPVTTLEQLADPKFELSLVSPDGAQKMIQDVGDFLLAQEITKAKIDAKKLVNGSYLQQYLANRPKK